MHAVRCRGMGILEVNVERPPRRQDPEVPAARDPVPGRAGGDDSGELHRLAVESMVDVFRLRLGAAAVRALALCARNRRGAAMIDKRRALQLHVAAAILTTGVLALLNLVKGSAFDWWPLVAVAWGGPLAVHVVLASGLLGPGDK